MGQNEFCKLSAPALDKAKNRDELQCIVNVLQYEADNSQDLLDYSLSEAIRMTGSRYGYIYFYDEATRIFTLNSWSRDVIDSCRVRDPQTTYELEKTGVWGEAVRQRKPIVLNDFAAPDPLKKGMPEGHVGLTRFLTIPLFDSGRIVAVIGVANKPAAYDESDVIQLSLLMEAVWKMAARRLSEEKLHDAKELFRVAVETSNDVVFDWKPGGKIQWHSSLDTYGTGRLVEFPETYEEWVEMLHQEDSRKVLDALQNHLEHDLPYNIEYRVVQAGGHFRWWLARGAAIRDVNGKAIRLIGTISDVTARKHYEDQLEQKNKELERFMYTISHDLKSPLVTISTFLTYLKQDMANGDSLRIDQDMAYMRSATDKMETMLMELLELFRVGKETNRPEQVRLKEIYDEALLLVAGHISQRRVTVICHEDDPTLYADRFRLNAIWQNLVENAVKYMGSQSQPRIELGVEQQEDENVFFVRDNGIGIDAKYRENIFGLFNKLDMGTAGTGLGLAMVKRIVESYKGSIWVESDGPGKGSCFRFTLPGAIKLSK
jgi:signal transduction histidine kinase